MEARTPWQPPPSSQKGLDRQLYAAGLEPQQRVAILAVLEDPPAGLEELRGVLARDHRDRSSA